MGADETPCLTMFESKEEVERTMLALKIFPDIDQVVAAEQEEPETDEEEYAPQVFPEHTAAETRYTRSPWADLPSAPGTYSMPVYRDRPDTVTNHGPTLPPLLSEAWRGSEAWREERSALHQLGLQAPKPGLQYRGRCPVLRWGSTTLRWGSVAAWPLLLTPG